jgi:ketosteroid isomerase-like protein
MQGDATNFSMRKNWRTILVLLLFQVLALAAFAGPQRPGMPRAQKHEVHREIDQKEEAWRDAVLKGNIAALDALLADDYMAISASGTLQSKEQALANVRNGQLHFTALEFSDRKVHFYGTTALVTSRAEVTATAGDKDISGSYRYIRVYVRDARGVWKVVSFEASRIRESGDPR